MKIWRRLICLFACAAFGLGNVSADELADVSKELYPLKREFRKYLPKVDRFKNADWKQANMASIKAKAAVGKMIDTHPSLEALRQKKAAAKEAYDAARKADDDELTKKLMQEMRDADGELHREAFKLQEVKDLQAASVAARRKVESIQYDLVEALGGEAKELTSKLRALEARHRELLKKQ